MKEFQMEEKIKLAERATKRKWVVPTVTIVIGVFVSVGVAWHPINRNEEQTLQTENKETRPLSNRQIIYTQNLIHNLWSANTKIRIVSGEKLVRIGDPVIEFLIPYLASDNVDNYLPATSVLERIGSQHLINILIQEVRSSNVNSKTNAIKTLTEIHPYYNKKVTLTIISSINDETHKVKQAAMWYPFEQTPISAQAVKPLIRNLMDTEKRIRGLAAFRLGRIGSASKDAIPYLMRMRNDKSPDVVGNSITAIGKIGSHDEKVIKFLIDILNDTHDEYHEHHQRDAANALGNIGPAARKALPYLHELQLTANRDFVRRAAQEAQTKIASPNIKFHPAKDKTIDEFIAQLGGPFNESVIATEALAHKGLDAIPKLIEVVSRVYLTSSEYSGGQKALLKIGKIAIPYLISSLENSLKLPKGGGCNGLIETLGLMRAKEAVPILIMLLEKGGGNVYTRAHILKALGHISDQYAERALIKELQSNTARHKREAVEGLGLIIFPSTESTEELIIQLKNKDYLVRWAAVDSLLKHWIINRDPKIVTAIEQAFKIEKEPYVRNDMAKVIDSFATHTTKSKNNTS